MARPGASARIDGMGVTFAGQSAASIALVFAASALVVACGGAEMQRPAPEAPRPSAPAAARRTPAPKLSAAQQDESEAPADVPTERVAVPIGDGSDLARGRSTVIVGAPIHRVRESVLDFNRYAEFMPHYRKCRVLGRTSSGARDVYMEVEALFGAVVMWARIEMPKATMIDGVETYASKFIEGNVKDFAATWRLRAVDEAHTELSLEVFLHPKIPMPDAMMNEENLDGSSQGVVAMKARAER